ncbi:MAG: hypothetical protein PHQ72_01145 [Hespellia sp.]|nr:hypothetical protein [Hespellia sp.]
MNDAFEDLGKKLSETAEALADKTGELIEIQKLKNQIRTLKRGNLRDYSDIGKMYYEKYKAGEVIDAEAAALCEAISTREEQIEGFEKEVTARKDTI